MLGWAGIPEYTFIIANLEILSTISPLDFLEVMCYNDKDIKTKERDT